MSELQWSVPVRNVRGVERSLHAQQAREKNKKKVDVVEEENVERDEEDEQEEEPRTTEDLLALRRFKALAGEWTSEDLGRCFWLTPEDRLEVKTCRGAANRLGFALNLLLMRLLHC